MAKTQGNASIKERIGIREPDMYDVVMINDDFTTMDFVVDVLKNIFYHSSEEAERIMLNIHHKGKGVAGRYTLDIAQSKVKKTLMLAKEEGFPLRLDIIKAS